MVGDPCLFAHRRLDGSEEGPQVYEAVVGGQLVLEPG